MRSTASLDGVEAGTELRLCGSGTEHRQLWRSFLVVHKFHPVTVSVVTQI